MAQGESCIRIISRFQSLIDTLDVIFFEREDAEAKKSQSSASWTKFIPDVTASGWSFKSDQYIIKYLQMSILKVHLNHHKGELFNWEIAYH